MLFVDLLQQYGIKLQEKETFEPLASPGLDYDDEERMADLHERQKRVQKLGADSKQMVHLTRKKKVLKARYKMPDNPQNFDPKQDMY